MKHFAIALLSFAVLGVRSICAEAVWSGGWECGLSLHNWEDPRWRSAYSDLELEFRVERDRVRFLGSGIARWEGTKREASLEPVEIFVDLRTSAGRWVLGLQRIRWGQSLALPVMDRVCPSDYRTLFRGSGDREPLAVWALDWSLDFSGGQIEFVYVPLFRPALFPEGVSIEADLPDADPSEGEGGGRIRFFLPFGDIGAAWYFGHDSVPVYLSTIQIIDTVPVLVTEGHYRPYFLVGWDIALPAGPILVRIENGWALNRRFTRNAVDLEPFQSHQVSILAGIDWMSGDWSLVAECFFSYRFREGDVPVDRRESLQWALDFSRGFAGGRWEAGLAGLWDVLEKDWYLDIRTIYRPADALEFLGGVEIPWGDDGIFRGTAKEAIPYLRGRFSF